MFKGNNTNNSSSKPKAKAMESNAPDRLNRIVEGTVIEGEIKCDSNIRIDGVIKGTIATKGRLVIGPSGRIEGDVVCRNADIEGQLDGKINVNELLSLKATAKINGQVTTGKLAVEPGAVINAGVDMGGIVKDIANAKEESKAHTAKAATA